LSKHSKIIRVAAGIIFFSLLIVHVALLLLGRSWFLTTLLFYSAIGLFVFFLIRKLFFRKLDLPSQQIGLKKLRYSVLFVVLILILTDSGIRVFTKKYRSYSENNYGWFYYSPFFDGISDIKMILFIGDKSDGKVHPPNSSYTYKSADFSFQHTYNELGLRERKNMANLIKGKELILSFGDSFTEGVGTTQDSTWQIILERNLNKSAPDKYFVANAGVSGYDPVEAYNLCSKFSSEYQPDYVILSFGSNDITDLIQRDKMDIDNNTANFFQPAGYYFYSWSYLFRVFSTWIYDYPELFMNESKFKRKCTEAVNLIAEITESIALAGKTKSFKTIVVFYPVKNEMITGKYNFPELQKTIDELKSNPDILVVDILQFFNNTRESFIIPADILYWPRDGHMTPPGYRMWAEILSSEMMVSGVLEEKL
jgi:lysophospholipase L1-like esterase